MSIIGPERVLIRWHHRVMHAFLVPTVLMDEVGVNDGGKEERMREKI